MTDAPKTLPYDDAPLPEDDFADLSPAPEQEPAGRARTKGAKARRRKYVPSTGAKAVRYEPTPQVFKACVDSVSRALAELGIFDQGARLVRITTLREKTTYGRKENIRFDAGTSITVPVTPDDVLSLVQQHIPVERWDARQGAFVVKEPPANLITAVMMVRSGWPYRFLSGIANCPCLRADGSILDKEGYDEATGLYVAFHGTTFPPVSFTPSPEEVRKAWELLEDMLAEFPFARAGEDGEAPEDDTARLNKAVALAMLFTPLARRACDNAPLFAVSAHTPCSGKSTLAKVAGITATGCDPAAITVAKEDVEFEKAFFALLLKGAQVCQLDNISRPLNPDMLCSALTQHAIEARVLGATKTAVAYTSSTFIATGNNLQICGDLIRRTMLCMLNRNEERPDEHLYKRNIEVWTKEHRPQIVHAILTIMRAYHVAGHTIRTPEHPEGLPQRDVLKPLGSFEDWSDWVRGPIVDAGYPDPIESRRKLEDEDPDKAAFARVLMAWHEAYGRNPMPLSSVFKDFNNTQDPRKHLYYDLQEALEEAVPHRGDLRINSTGKWFERKKGGFAGGYQLVKVGASMYGNLWKVNPPKS